MTCGKAAEPPESLGEKKTGTFAETEMEFNNSEFNPARLQAHFLNQLSASIPHIIPKPPRGGLFLDK
jgi:hypothetical protein